MTNRKVYGDGEAASIVMQKFTPTASDVILIRLPDNIDRSQMQAFADQFNSVAMQTGCSVVLTTDGVDVEMFSAEAMNELGWFKQPKGE